MCCRVVCCAVLCFAVLCYAMESEYTRTHGTVGLSLLFVLVRDCIKCPMPFDADSDEKWQKDRKTKETHPYSATYRLNTREANHCKTDKQTQRQLRPVPVYLYFLETTQKQWVSEGFFQ
jgi:hypothetical protein